MAGARPKVWMAATVASLCCLASTAAQVYVSEPRHSAVPAVPVSVVEQPGAAAAAADSSLGAGPGAPAAPPAATSTRVTAAEETLTARLSRLEMLDAKLSSMDVLEKVFNFVHMDANVATIGQQVDRIWERLSRGGAEAGPSAEHAGAGAAAAHAGASLQQRLDALGSRLQLLERSVSTASGALDSQLDRLHAQLDALLEKNVQLNTKLDTMREAVSLLLRASEVVDDQLEQTDDNLRYLRDQLQLVKTNSERIQQQQTKSEAAMRAAVQTAHQSTDKRVGDVERSADRQLKLVVGELSFLSHTIWRAVNETRVSAAAGGGAQYADYLDDLPTSVLEDPAFRAKLVAEIGAAVVEGTRAVVGDVCERRRAVAPALELNSTAALLTALQTSLNDSIALAAAGQFRPADCSEVRQRRTSSGIATIYPNACARAHHIQVYCDQDTAGGGWTVIQSRGGATADVDAPVNFYQNWNTYKWGFGNLSSEFYLGNEPIHLLTSSGDFVLRIELEDFSGARRYAQYRHFSIEDERHHYRLHVGEYKGNAGDALSYHDGLLFSTRDQEHDTWPGKNCASHYGGGWWFGSCHKANLNGAYLSGSHGSYGSGVIWYPWRGYYYSLRAARMLVRPRRVHQRSPDLQP